MRYISTRGEAPPLDFVDAILVGLARDGGLYVPESWPVFDKQTIAGFAGRPYAEVAVEIIRPFVGDSIPEAELARMAREAYGSFRHPAVVPLVQYGPGRFVLELFHGPTLAFKDVAMQLLARVMDYALKRRGERATIVGATSGDTGGAAIEAFRGLDQVDVFILYPDGRVSDVQRQMMTTPVEHNVHAIAIEGTFDDCQAIVKGMFNHHSFRDKVNLSSVNSINWARIAAQIVYYFTAAVSLGAPHRQVAFTVPTGNFGDAFAGYVAWRMGLPIERLVIATNVNDIMMRTIQSGEYVVREVMATSAPSMDVQVSSNFERLLFDAYGRDASAIRALMNNFAQSRRFKLSDDALLKVRSFLSANRADEEEIETTIRTIRKETGYLVDPHTAVGIAVAEKEARDSAVPMVVLATAHPAKFPAAVERACQERPKLPDWLSDLADRPEQSYPLLSNGADVERFILEYARAVKVASLRPRTPSVFETHKKRISFEEFEVLMTSFARGKIEDAQKGLRDHHIEAAKRFFADFSYATRGNTGASDGQVKSARRRVLQALEGVGEESSGVILDFYTHFRHPREIEREKKLPANSGYIAFHFALDRLARHYGTSQNIAITGSSIVVSKGEERDIQWIDMGKVEISKNINDIVQKVLLEKAPAQSTQKISSRA